MLETYLDRLMRRIQMLFGRGRLTFVDDSGSVQIVQVKTNDLETSDTRYRMMEFGFSSNPPLGSDALMLHVAGDRSAGAVVATNHQPSRPTGLQSGESMLYSQDGKQVYLTADGGIVVEAKGQPVTINDASDVTCNCSGVFKVIAPGGVVFDAPTVSATGDIIDQSETGGKSMASMRATYNDHDHNDPQGGVVGTPNQQM